MSAVPPELPRASADPTEHTTEQSGPESQAGPAGTDFGANEWLVDEMYQRYLADPSSVAMEWWNFFADYQPPGGSAQTAATARQQARPAPGPATPVAPAPGSPAPGSPAPGSPAPGSPAPQPAGPAPAGAAATAPAPGAPAPGRPAPGAPAAGQSGPAAAAPPSTPTAAAPPNTPAAPPAPARPAADGKPGPEPAAA